MAEKSLFWTTGTSGDGASTYTESELITWLRRTWLTDNTTQGVLLGYLNGLAVSGTASPVSVASGGAVVYGYPYENTAAVNVSVSTPVAGTTGHRIVLRVDHTARTVRIVLKSSADGTATPPAVTQSAGTTWEISLATLTITTGGVITVTDTRAYVHPTAMVATANLDDLAVTTAKIAAGAVTAAKLDSGLAVPSGLIALFDTACPSGWTRVSAWDGLFPRGASSYGGTGGASTHTHTGPSHTHAVAIGALSYTSIGGTPVVTNGVGNLVTSGGAGSDSGAVSPTTQASGTGNTGSASSLPPYIDVVFCKKN